MQDPGGIVERRHPVNGRRFQIDLRTGHSIAIDVAGAEGRRQGASRCTIVNRANLNKGLSLGPAPKRTCISLGDDELSASDDDEFPDSELDAIIASLPLRASPRPPDGPSSETADYGTENAEEMAIVEATQAGALASINRSALERARVLDQVDGKFLVCSTTMAGSSTPVLFCVDQHAADERVRLEGLLEEYAARCEDGNGAHRLEVALALDVTVEQYGALQTTPVVGEEMSRLGWHIERSDAVLRPAMRPSVDVRGVPYILKDRTLTERGRPKNEAMLADVFANCIEEIQQREVDRVARKGSINNRTRTHCSQSAQCGAATAGRRSQASISDKESRSRRASRVDWVSFTRRMPSTLLEVVKSKACRSAIMFNDPMQRGVGERLVGRLAACQFPFQCAHGRPTLAPLCQIVTTER